jgi:hypothetical protein
MKLADLRKLAIRRQTRIRFRLRNGQECVITEHGVAQVPALKGVPDFNLEDELASASTFQLDPVIPIRKGHPAASNGASVAREELSAMASGGPAAESPVHEDD